MDVICINQDSIEDKNTLVEKMSFIYENNKKTLVILENTNKEDIKKLKIIEKKLFGKESVVDNDNIKEKVNSVLNDFKKYKIETLYKDKWFSRVWTLQELSCSEELIFYTNGCLYNATNFIKNVKLIKNIEIVKYGLNRLFRNLSLNLLILNTSKNNITIGETIQSVSTRSCKIDQDRIFGVLGMLKVDLNVNYKKTLDSIYKELIYKVTKKGDISWFGHSNNSLLPKIKRKHNQFIFIYEIFLLEDFIDKYDFIYEERCLLKGKYKKIGYVTKSAYFEKQMFLI